MVALGIEIEPATDTVGHQVLFDALWEYAIVSHSYKSVRYGAG